MAGDPPKKVDESWKDTVEKERSFSPAEEPPAESPESGFLEFISTLAMQSMMALGEMAHPETGQNHENLPQAKYLIDTLRLLSDKTKGNLSTEEAAALKNILYELEIKFVKKSGAVS